ncbi:MAG: 50S ribosomal protein L11 methyltransferase [Pseudomonadota bacterium]
MSAGLRLARLSVPPVALAAVDEIATSAGAAVWADLEGDPDPVPVELTLPPDLDAEALTAGLSTVMEAFNLPRPEIAIETLPDCDWLAEVQRSLPALTAGDFYVYGQHIAAPPPADKIALQVEAALAFGSGHHQSTQACLETVSDLAAEGWQAAKVLDMGCGSGILAMAAAKLWPCQALAADVHAVSVEVARENSALNAVSHQVTTLVSDGYAAPQIAEQAPYHLIFANILAKPLIGLAPDLARHLAPGGRAILAGLLIRESADVLAAHEAQGLTLLSSRDLDPWRCLLLERPSA